MGGRLAADPAEVTETPTTSDHAAARGAAEVAVRWALAIGIAFQVAQRFAKTGYELSEYGRSL